MGLLVNNWWHYMGPAQFLKLVTMYRFIEVPCDKCVEDEKEVSKTQSMLQTPEDKDDT